MDITGNNENSSWREDDLIAKILSNDERKQIIDESFKILEEFKEDQAALSLMSGNQGNNYFQDFDFTDPITPLQSEDDFAPIPHINPQITNLKQLVSFIQGDLYHCAVCSSKFEEPSNLPRVLFCGDCLCERCIRSAIQPRALNQDSKNSDAAGQLTCLICNQVHIFKMTRHGFIVSNDKFVRYRDDQGLINLLGSKTLNYTQEAIQRAMMNRQMMDNSLNVPSDLIIRSLPVNVELLEMIREEKNREQQNYKSVIQHIGKFIHLD